MYQVEASKALLKPRLWARRSVRLSGPRNVVMLGLVSLLTDVSSEMVATVLPLYLVFSLGASPLLFGAIDGTYRGAAALVQAGTPRGAAAAIAAADRVGKGTRTAPRDALISLSSAKDRLATSFGV